MSPAPGESGFTQWLSAMQMVARLQGGIPAEFRRTLWLTLADKHLQRRGVDWPQAERLCFSEWSNPDDDELGVQIVKDLHRTGCSMFCGQSNQAVLKRVLLAYARWNKAVGYCQGFNMLAALILQVMDRNEPDSVKVMIYLIEGVLPESYFANNLRGLSVDMAVFRDLLRLRLPQLSRHLEHLQMDAGDNTGTSYEPPLTNVFTMQWFLTLFCNCLPQPTVLRVWDLIFLEGNQILLRTALAIWDHLSDRIMAVSSADEFYSIMGVLTREILEFGHTDSNRLMKTVVAMKCPELPSLRDKYMYNITPWTSTVSSGLRRARRGLRLLYTEDDSGDSGDNSDQDDDERIAVAAAFGIADLFRSPRRRGSVQTGSGHRGPGSAGSAGSAGSSSGAGLVGPLAAPDRERLSLDVSMLKQQYCRLRERQRQAHIIVTAACGGLGGLGGLGSGGPLNAPSVAMNHLLLGKPALRSAKGRRLPPPHGAVPPPAAPGKTPAAPAAPNTAKRHSQPAKPVETLHWKDEDRRRKSQAEVNELPVLSRPATRSGSPGSQGSHSRSSSRSSSSSTSTELCDEQPSEEEPDHGDLLQFDDKQSQVKDPHLPKDSDLLLGKSPHLPKDSDLLLGKSPHLPKDSVLVDLMLEKKDAELSLLDQETTEQADQCSKETRKLVQPDVMRFDQPDGEETRKPTSLQSRVEAVSSKTIRETEVARSDEGDFLQWDTVAAEPTKARSTVPKITTDGSEISLLADVPSTEATAAELGAGGASPSPSSDRAAKVEEDLDELLARLREESQTSGEAPFASGWPEQLVPDLGDDVGARSPEHVVASVTEKLRLIMEHLEHGLSRTPSEDSSAAARESSPTSTSSRESRQRLMDKLFGRDGSLIEESDDVSAASLKSSALELDLSGLLDEASEEESSLQRLQGRARSAAGDVEGVTASSRRHSLLDRQNSEKASRIIRENSEILQRMTAWHRGGRSLTMPERSEPPRTPGPLGVPGPPDLLTSSPVHKRTPTATLLEDEEDLVTTTATTAAASTAAADPPPALLLKQTSLDETKRPAKASSDKLQLTLDSAETAQAPSTRKASALLATKPKYKFPEMSPVNTSPLQPLPATSLLCNAEGTPKKWRPELSPPSTPMVEAAIAAASTSTASTSTASASAYLSNRSKKESMAKSPVLDRSRPVAVVGSVTLDAPTALPVQTPSLAREGPRLPSTPQKAPHSPPSPPSPPGKLATSTGRRRKDKSPDGGVDLAGSKSPVSFNPFPSRTNIRQPKEIGVKLGLYPNSATPSTTSARKPDRL